MSLIKMTVQDFVEQLASPSPTPGGGSASALAGAMAAAMAGMAGIGWVADTIGPAAGLVGIGVLLFGTATVAAAFSRLHPRPTALDVIPA